MSLRWNLRIHDAHTVESIEQHSRVSPIIAQLLAARGITTPQEVESFFNLKMTGLRSPAELPGLSEAVAVLFDAIQAGKKVFVYRRLRRRRHDIDRDSVSMFEAAGRQRQLFRSQSTRRRLWFERGNADQTEQAWCGIDRHG